MPTGPVIGISPDNQAADQPHPVYELPSTYALAIEKAGGIPILLPHTANPATQAAYMHLIDGLLIPGGNDMNPSLYGQAPHPTMRCMDSLREKFDLAMLALAQARNMPVLGICLGCQAMNVQRRGSLHQYLPDVARDHPISHTGNPANSSDKNVWHSVSLAQGSRLRAIVKCDKLSVNSRHRQAVDRLGTGLTGCAASPDGVVEAIEDNTLKFWIGVQWHAETLAEPPHTELFNAFIAAAATNAHSSC